ncbi:hypothetical protein BX600DRAFT_443882 [Xylariales sp. PMI_506]|nr:hypothetical protein BX600DRAFT_443882 [Xylariales sp. PMI_506]
MSNGSYSALDSDSEKGEQDSFLSDTLHATDDRTGITSLTNSRRLLNRLLTIVPWLLTTLFATLSAVLLLAGSHLNDSSSFGIYESGFNTDINPNARWPENMVLFGSPNHEIDRNWGRLIGNRYFSISEDEAQRAWGEKRHEYIDQWQGGYSAGPSIAWTRFGSQFNVMVALLSFQPSSGRDWGVIISTLTSCTLAALSSSSVTLRRHGNQDIRDSEKHATAVAWKDAHRHHHNPDTF